MHASLYTESWNTPRKIVFRFFAIYFILYIFPFPVNFLLEDIWGIVGGLFEPIVIWVGQHILHFTNMPNEDNGGGDAGYNYAQILSFLLAAVVGTLLWSALDRKRANYTRLLYWLKVVLRYYLAFYLLVYGLSKFGSGQFRQPTLMKLVQPYGQSSPMGLAWTFLGFSPAYGIFMGISECAGGILMLFRRTTLLGACIASAVLLNVVMINFCFDVPVKIFSSHLLLITLFVLSTEFPRFLNVFVYNQAAQPIDLSPVFAQPRWANARIAVKTIVFLALACIPVIMLAQGNENPKPPLYGIYTVKKFTRDGIELPPLTTDDIRWNMLVVPYAGSAYIQTMAGEPQSYPFHPDTVKKTIRLTQSNTEGTPLAYAISGDTLRLSGVFDNNIINVELLRHDERDYLLTNRGFHLINDYPLNR